MSGLNYVASEIRHAREAMGWTQDRLATETHYSTSLVAMVESGSRVPSPDFVRALDRAMGTAGRFERMRTALLVPESRDEWFRDWVDDFEQIATEIRVYEPTVIPGMLQIEPYAYTLLGDPDKVTARMARQSIIERATVVTIIDESALYRQVGSPDTMAEQLLALSKSAATVHILPGDAETYLGVDGSFMIATVDGQDVAYCETPARGFVLPDTGVASGLRARWEALASESLPRSQSRATLGRVGEEWRQKRNG